MANINIEQLQPIIDNLHEESDRACVVLGGATLDAVLGNLLKKALRPDSPKELFEHNGALGTFSAKIDLAYAFGLISKNERHDLHLLRKIRNDFAHDIDYTLSFTTDSVSNRIRSLAILSLFNNHPILAG